MVEQYIFLRGKNAFKNCTYIARILFTRRQFGLQKSPLLFVFVLFCKGSSSLSGARVFSHSNVRVLSPEDWGQLYSSPNVYIPITCAVKSDGFAPQGCVCVFFFRLFNARNVFFSHKNGQLWVLTSIMN